MCKARINVHIDSETRRRLDALAERRNVSKASLVDAALGAFLSPEHDDRRDAAILKRLDQLGRRLEKIARAQAIANETLSLFVRYYLTVTPPLPEADRRAARALGNERYAYFKNQLSKKLAAGKSTGREAAERITPAESDFFTATELAESGPDEDTAADAKSDRDGMTDADAETVSGDTGTDAGSVGGDTRTDGPA